MNTQAKQVFQKVYKGEKNFITSKVLDYLKIGNLYIEISAGKTASGDIYGVTVIEEVVEGEYEKRHDLSKPFVTKEQVEAYIHHLASSYK